jgi:hypothetical protein
LAAPGVAWQGKEARPPFPVRVSPSPTLTQSTPLAKRPHHAAESGKAPTGPTAQLEKNRRAFEALEATIDRTHAFLQVPSDLSAHVNDIRIVVHLRVA